MCVFLMVTTISLTGCPVGGDDDEEAEQADSDSSPTGTFVLDSDENILGGLISYDEEYIKVLTSNGFVYEIDWDGNFRDDYTVYFSEEECSMDENEYGDILVWFGSDVAGYYYEGDLRFLPNGYVCSTKDQSTQEVEGDVGDYIQEDGVTEYEERDEYDTELPSRYSNGECEEFNDTLNYSAYATCNLLEGDVGDFFGVPEGDISGPLKITTIH